ncbi:MAG: winged helix-turn-helix domain-containing protein [Saprospiraceae bacterium]
MTTVLAKKTLWMTNSGDWNSVLMITSTKTFHIAELNARVKAVLRRHTKEKHDRVGQHLPDLMKGLFSSTRTSNFKTGKSSTSSSIFVQQTAWSLYPALAEYVWGDHIDQTDNFDFIYSQIKNIRRKLKDSEAQIEIQAVYGGGYKLVML